MNIRICRHFGKKIAVCFQWSWRSILTVYEGYSLENRVIWRLHGGEAKIFQTGLRLLLRCKESKPKTKQQFRSSVGLPYCASERMVPLGKLPVWLVLWMTMRLDHSSTARLCFWIWLARRGHWQGTALIQRTRSLWEHVNHGIDRELTACKIRR